MTDTNYGSSWLPSDLERAWNDMDRVEAELFERTDGVPMLYRGKTHVFFGESESGKSLAAQYAVAQVLTAGGKALYIDFEDTTVTLVQRLKSLGVPYDAVVNGLASLCPSEALFYKDAYQPGMADLKSLLEQNFDLCVIDGVTEAMALEGLDPNKGEDIARWNQILTNRIAASGAAVVLIDHISKGSDTNRRFMIGSQHKLSALTGASFRFDVLAPWGRALKEPSYGKTKIVVTKDRRGRIRPFTDDLCIGIMEVATYPGDETTVKIVPPGRDRTMPTLKMVEGIGSYLAIYPGSTKNKVETEVQGKADSVREALRWMIDNGYVTVDASGAYPKHALTVRYEKEYGHA